MTQSSSRVNPDFLPELGVARDLSAGLTRIIETAVGVALAVALLDFAKAMVVRGERRLVGAELAVTLLLTVAGVWLVW